MNRIALDGVLEEHDPALDKGKEPLKPSSPLPDPFAPGLKKPDIQRLSFSAGIKSLDGAIYEEIREILNDYVRGFVRRAILIMLVEDHKILTVQHLSGALKTKGERVAAVPRSTPEDTSYLEKCALPTFKGEHQFLKKIEYYQSHSDSLIFEKGPFKKFLKWVIAKIESRVEGDGIKVSPGFVLLSQFLCEWYVIELFRKAGKCAIHAGRQTLQTRDLNLVLELGAI